MNDKASQKVHNFSSFFVGSKLLEQFAKQIEHFSAIEIDHYLRSDLQTFDFKDAKDALTRLKAFCQAIDTDSLDKWPFPNHEQVKNALSDVEAKLNRMLAHEYKAGEGDPVTVQKQILSGVEHGVKDVIRHMYPIVSYMCARNLNWADAKERVDNEVATAVAAVKTAHNKATGDIDDEVNGVKRIYKEANEALSAIQGKIAEEAAEKQATHFDDLADSHARAAKKWLGGTILSGVIVVAFAIGVSFAHKLDVFNPDGDYSLAAQMITAKILLFATLTYFLYMSARNYTSHRHNSVVNAHRANALKTYRAIVEAAGDESNRNAVLIQAASCIFSPQPSGYGGSDAHEGTTQRAVIEMLSKQTPKQAE
ncbi:hypothetical protein OT109_17075 [Phycisphaeraceae bacterium D3-23]